MSDPQGDSPESMQTRLSRSMGTVWQNHTGDRPGTVSAVIDGDVVRCAIEKAEGQSPETAGYRNEAIAMVARVMGRRVNAFIPKHDKKTDVTTDTFILEPPRVRR
jgi:hypothetical protein